MDLVRSQLRQQRINVRFYRWQHIIHRQTRACIQSVTSNWLGSKFSRNINPLLCRTANHRYPILSAKKFISFSERIEIPDHISGFISDVEDFLGINDDEEFLRRNNRVLSKNCLKIVSLGNEVSNYLSIFIQLRRKSKVEIEV